MAYTRSFDLKLRICIVFLVSLTFGILLAGTAIAETPATNTLDIVVMLDVSGSISDGDLVLEKNAVTTLVNNAAGLTPPPRIAVGSFNVTDNDDGARIISPLTTNFPKLLSDTNQYLDGLIAKFNQPGYRGGFTDLTIALAKANATFQTANPLAAQKYIVLISDGVPNRPCDCDDSIRDNPCFNDPNKCGACGFQHAYDFAQGAADQITKNGSGVKIFPIYFAGSGKSSGGAQCSSDQIVKGLSFMKDTLSLSSGFFGLGSLPPIAPSPTPTGGSTPNPTPTPDLTGAIGNITCQFSCDDADPCTIDACDTSVGKCTHAINNTDSDADGVPNCKDKCIGADSSIGAACATGEGACKRAGAFVCGFEGKLVCAGATNLIDSAACFGCVKTSQSATVDSINNITSQQSSSLAALIAHYRKLVGKDKVGKKKAKAFATALAQINQSLIASIKKIPVDANVCSDRSACPIVAQTLEIELIKGNSASLSTLATSVTSKIRRSAKKLSKADRKNSKLVKTLVGKVTDLSATLATFTSSCN